MYTYLKVCLEDIINPVKIKWQLTLMWKIQHQQYSASFSFSFTVCTQGWSTHSRQLLIALKSEQLNSGLCSKEVKCLSAL